MNSRHSRLLRLATLAGFVLASLAGAPSALASTNVKVVLSPTGNYHNEQTITVSAGPNAAFSSGGGLALHVAECADPGGLVSRLPTSVLYCDGDTSTRVVTKPDGSFTTPFLMYVTPIQNYEPADSLPKCNAKQYCVLMISQNLNNFGEFHVFTAPFLVGSESAPPVTAAGVGVRVATRPTATKSSGVPVLVIVIGGLLVVVLALLAGLRFGRRSARA